MKEEIERHITFGERIDVTGDAFAAVCDAVEFGVDGHGNPFDTFTNSWSAAEKVRWAEACSLFFLGLSQKLIRYSEALRQKEGPGERRA